MTTRLRRAKSAVARRAPCPPVATETPLPPRSVPSGHHAQHDTGYHSRYHIVEQHSPRRVKQQRNPEGQSEEEESRLPGAEDRQLPAPGAGDGWFLIRPLISFQVVVLPPVIDVGVMNDDVLPPPQVGATPINSSVIAISFLTQGRFE